MSRWEDQRVSLIRETSPWAARRRAWLMHTLITNFWVSSSLLRESVSFLVVFLLLLFWRLTSKSSSSLPSGSRCKDENESVSWSGKRGEVEVWRYGGRKEGRGLMRDALEAPILYVLRLFLNSVSSSFLFSLHFIQQYKFLHLSFLSFLLCFH